MNALGAIISIIKGHIEKITVEAIKGIRSLNFCLKFPCSFFHIAIRNMIYISAVVIRDHVANVSKAPISANSQYLELACLGVAKTAPEGFQTD
jgi:hypothetical protein